MHFWTFGSITLRVLEKGLDLNEPDLSFGEKRKLSGMFILFYEKTS